MTARQENSRYLTEQIITYLGNKRSLLKDIESEVIAIQNKLNKSKTRNLDLFSGSGIVARLLKKYSSLLVTNDLEKYSQVINNAYLSNHSEINWQEYEGYRESIIARIKDDNLIKGIIANNYAPEDDAEIKLGERVFYTTKNAQIIDTVRFFIEDLRQPYKNLFLAQLLAEASAKNNTAGVFKGFYKDSLTGIGKFGGNGAHALSRIKGEISIDKPILSRFECEYKVYKEDAGNLAEKIKDFDIVYIDPPYNQHPYGSNYFMLNLIVENKQPDKVSKVSGIPKEWNKSNYNIKNQAREEVDKLIAKVDSKYIILSYNSEGFISYKDMVSLLKKYGTVTKREIVYNTYRGSRNLINRNLYVKEHLFVLQKM